MSRYELVQGHPPVLVDRETGHELVLSNHTEITIARLIVEIDKRGAELERSYDRVLVQLREMEQKVDKIEECLKSTEEGLSNFNKAIKELSDELSEDERD